MIFQIWFSVGNVLYIRLIIDFEIIMIFLYFKNYNYYLSKVIQFIYLIVMINVLGVCLNLKTNKTISEFEKYIILI